MPRSKIQFITEANGRVNLICEHTDYNGGWVLPTAIPQKTGVKLRLRDDMIVSATTGAHFSNNLQNIKYKLSEEHPTKTWIDYLQGGSFI